MKSKKSFTKKQIKSAKKIGQKIAECHTMTASWAISPIRFSVKNFSKAIKKIKYLKKSGEGGAGQTANSSFKQSDYFLESSQARRPTVGADCTIEVLGEGFDNTQGNLFGK